MLKVLSFCLYKIQETDSNYLQSSGFTYCDFLRLINSTFSCQSRIEATQNLDNQIEETLTKFIFAMIDLICKSDNNQEGKRILATFLRLDGIAFINKVAGKTVRDVFSQKHRQFLNQTKPNRCLESILNKPASLTCLAVQSIRKYKVPVEDSQLPSTLIWFLKRH